jgi:hypothetical protein
VKITELGFEVEGLNKFLFTPDSYLIFIEDTGVEILYIVYNIYIPFAIKIYMTYPVYVEQTCHT